MLYVYQQITPNPWVRPDKLLILPYELRKKSRFRTQCEDGSDIGLLLPRGTVLPDGAYLQTDCGLIIQVQAAIEQLSQGHSSDPLSLLKAAYHLGNRHVALQITEHYLCYQHDHVLDAMLQQLGLEVTIIEAPFQPEAGAYAGGHQHEH